VTEMLETEILTNKVSLGNKIVLSYNCNRQGLLLETDLESYVTVS
jgi:hypothetical protein